MVWMPFFMVYISRDNLCVGTDVHRIRLCVDCPARGRACCRRDGI